MKTTIYVSVLFLIFCFSASGQNKLVTFSNNLAINLCNCLEEHSTKKPKTLLYEQSTECLTVFLQSNEATLMDLTNIYYSKMDITDYEKGRLLGKQLMINAIDTLVDNCPFYRQTVEEYRSILTKQLNPSKENAAIMIKRLQDKVAEIPEKEKRAKIYSLIGFLYDFMDEKENALLFYQKSISIQPSTSAKGLKRMLELKLTKSVKK
jgi:tetratricopeptide (TPR) repeat protein